MLFSDNIGESNIVAHTPNICKRFGSDRSTQSIFSSGIEKMTITEVAITESLVLITSRFHCVSTEILPSYVSRDCEPSYVIGY